MQVLIEIDINTLKPQAKKTSQFFFMAWNQNQNLLGTQRASGNLFLPLPYK